jgi:hypothetical protein
MKKLEKGAAGTDDGYKNGARVFLEIFCVTASSTAASDHGGASSSSAQTIKPGRRLQAF